MAESGFSPMDSVAGIASGPVFAPHPLRDTVIGEVHSRPFQPLRVPRTLLHYGFMTDAAGRADALDWLTGFCAGRRLPVPAPGARHHVAADDRGSLRFETHAEFTALTWDCDPDRIIAGTPFDRDFPQPGPLMVAIRVEVLPDSPDIPARLQTFDQTSLAISSCLGGRARIATDFWPGPDQAIRILVIDHGLGPHETGPLVQRVIELETYRTLALLGLPQAQKMAPDVNRIEQALADFMERFSRSEGLESNRRQFDDLTLLAAELEAGSAASAFRFGASRAYSEIVSQRLVAIGEAPVEFHLSWSAFLARRLAPAIRTCQAIERRQDELSRKLARAASLLRGRVDIALFEQNHAVLDAMARRVELQLRLQQTVEGLSVAAVSYYAIGLIAYLAKLPASWLHLDYALVPAVAVLPVVAIVWRVVHRVKARHQPPSH